MIKDRKDGERMRIGKENRMRIRQRNAFTCLCPNDVFFITHCLKHVHRHKHTQGVGGDGRAGSRSSVKNHNV